MWHQRHCQHSLHRQTLALASASVWARTCCVRMQQTRHHPGVIIGIVCAAVVVFALSLLGVVVCRRRRPRPPADMEQAAEGSAGVKADSMDTSDGLPAGVDSSASQRVVPCGEVQRGDMDRGGSGSVVSSLVSEMQHALSSAEYCHLVAPQDVQQLRQVCVCRLIAV